MYLFVRVMQQNLVKQQKIILQQIYNINKYESCCDCSNCK